MEYYEEGVSQDYIEKTFIRGELRFKNALFLRGMYSLGVESQKDFSRRFQFNYQEVNDIVNLRKVPSNKERRRRYCKILGYSDEDLFLRYIPIIEKKKNGEIPAKFKKDFSAPEFVSFEDVRRPLISDNGDPDFYDESLKIEIEDALKILSQKNAEIMRDLFGIDRDFSLTSYETAEKHNITTARVGQIKRRCLQKLESETLKTYL